ncbi:MAG: hypothetical protein V1726_03000 [Methanobacteriota archaeon]
MSIALALLFLLPPIPQEPANLPQDTWSYYGSQAPASHQLLRYRNELLFIIVICAISSEILFYVFEKRRRTK